MTTIWIGVDTIQRILAETVLALPLETGGMLLGYWGPDINDAVVMNVIDAGPDAVHTRAGFIPDGEWQQQQLEEMYRTSGRIQTYLGDWHSHPDGGAGPSPRDRHTARAVATDDQARTPHPITLIVAASPSVVVSTFVRRRRRVVHTPVQLF